jgi:uncharacterized protein involved in exopolysaccharide biosynthesis
MSDNTERPIIQARRALVEQLAAQVRAERQARQALRARMAQLEQRARSGETIPQTELDQLRIDAESIEATVNWDRFVPPPEVP